MELTHLFVFGCRSLLAERRRLLWVVLGLAMGIGLYVAISIMAAGYARLVALPFTQLNSDLIVQRAVQGGQEKEGGGHSGIRLPFSNQPLAPQEIAALEEVAGVEEVNRVVMLWYQQQKDFSIIAGVDPRDKGGPARVLSWIDKGRKIENPGEVVAESHYAKFHQIKVGSQVVLAGEVWQVVGIAKIKQGASVAAANYYLSLADARKLAGMADDSANMLFAGLQTGVDSEGVLGQLPTLIPGAYGTTADSIGSLLKGFARISTRVSWLLEAVTLGFAALVASWLVAGTLHERGPQMGLMRTVGWRRREIVVAVAAETLLLGLIGGLCGVGLGYLAALGLSQQEISIALPWSLTVQPGTVEHAGSGQTLTLPVSLSARIWMTALAVAVISPLVSGILVASRQAGAAVTVLLARE
jgi:putative ABC transport system permease protein